MGIIIRAQSLCQGECQTPGGVGRKGLTRLSHRRAAPCGVPGTSEGSSRCHLPRGARQGQPSLSLSPWEAEPPRPGCAGGTAVPSEVTLSPWRGRTGRCHILLAVYKQRAGGAAHRPCSVKNLGQPRWLPPRRWKSGMQRWRALPAAEVDGLHPVSITLLLAACPEPCLGLSCSCCTSSSPTKPSSWSPPPPPPPRCRMLHQHGGKGRPGMTSRLRFADRKSVV